MSKKVDVEMVLPIPLIEALDQIVATGVLGKSRSKVVNHMLRQYIFEQEMKARNDSRREDQSESQTTA